MLSKPKRASSELRTLGVSLGGAVLMVCGLIFPTITSSTYPIWPWIVGGSLAGIALLWPPAISPIAAIWVPVTTVVARVNTWILLTLVYCIILVPMAFLLRRRNKLQGGPLRVRSDRTYFKRATRKPRTTLERSF